MNPGLNDADLPSKKLKCRSVLAGLLELNPAITWTGRPRSYSTP